MVEQTIENLIKCLLPERRLEGKNQLLSLKKTLNQRLRANLDANRSRKDGINKLQMENKEMLEINEELKARVDGLEEDLNDKLLGENKRLRRLVEKLDNENSESAKLAKGLISKVVKRDFENQRLWKIKKRLSKEMMDNEKTLYDQMDLLYSALIPAPDQNCFA